MPLLSLGLSISGWYNSLGNLSTDIQLYNISLSLDNNNVVINKQSSLELPQVYPAITADNNIALGNMFAVSTVINSDYNIINSNSSNIEVVPDVLVTINQFNNIDLGIN